MNYPAAAKRLHDDDILKGEILIFLYLRNLCFKSC